MESINATREVVARLDDYRRSTVALASPDPIGDYQRLLSELDRLADCILTAAEIIARITPPPR
jgi:hypothetical protein